MASNGKLFLLRSVTKILPHENDVKHLINYFANNFQTVPTAIDNRSYAPRRPFPFPVTTVLISPM